MGSKGRHAYTVEVWPSRHVAGHYRWMIRDHGKLCRGSYRPCPTAEQARSIAEAEVQRLRDLEG